MHALYGFLISYDPTLETEEIADEAMDVFSTEYEPLCDENNGWHQQALILQNGQIIPLAEECNLFLLDIPPRLRFEAVHKECLIAAAIDMEIDGLPSFSVYHEPEIDQFKARCQSMSASQLVQYIQEKTALLLADRLAQASANLRSLPSQPVCRTSEPAALQNARDAIQTCDTLRLYDVQRLIDSYDHLQDTHCPPFSLTISEPDAPWRFYELTLFDPSTRPAKAILLVDIHT